MIARASKKYYKAEETFTANGLLEKWMTDEPTLNTAQFKKQVKEKINTMCKKKSDDDVGKVKFEKTCLKTQGVPLFRYSPFQKSNHVGSAHAPVNT